MDVSDHSTTPVGEHRRKRVRKGTRSCWECKRRKIRCVYQSEDHAVCAGCLDRGTTCLSQEYVDDQSPKEGNLALGQRMGRVEMLLEKLMEKVTSAIDAEQAANAYGIDVLTPSATPVSQYESMPLLSLFDNDVLARQGDGQHKASGSMRPPVTPLSSTGSTPNATGKCGRISRVEKLRRILAAMLPSQHDVDTLSEESQGWWLIRRHVLPQLVRFPEHDLSKPFDVDVVSSSHPMVIARLLLCVALCIQQLPPSFDAKRLHLSLPLMDVMDKITTTIAGAVTSDDELIGTMEGVECLLLHGIYQINAGNLRRSWLCFRRALNVSQLLGLHRASSRAPGAPLDLSETKRHYMWYQVVKGDRYLSLLLGVPSATGSSPFPFDDHAPWLTVEDVYNKQLCVISGLILDRNQSESTHAFSTTQEIDEKLDSLAKQMPRTWWEIPTIPEVGQTDAAAAQFDRMLSHIWHFELETLVHLPFMLRAATDRRYEYSRLSCMNASRGLIRRWMFMREANGPNFVCNIVEFQAFTAAVTLLLNILGPVSQSLPQFTEPMQREKIEDLELVESVVRILEGLKKYKIAGDHVIDQSLSIIRTLQSMLGNDANKPMNLRLTIPHFGTISVTRGGAVHALNNEQDNLPVPSKPNDETLASVQFDSTVHITPCEAPNNTWVPSPMPSDAAARSYGGSAVGSADGSTIPFTGSNTGGTQLQFTSSQFPTFFETQVVGGSDWPFQDNDIMLFDSLLYNDIEGNWNL